MTVAELIAELQKCPPDFPVYVGSLGSRWAFPVESVDGNIIKITGLPEKTIDAPRRQPFRDTRRRFIDKKPIGNRRRKKMT